MPARKALLAAPVVYLLLFFGLSRAGLLGPDEPRYASIGREMARSGDWVTPKLWGEPWFEKPALLYWMIAAGQRIGLGDDLSPRVPVALASLAFLIFYFRSLRREFGETAALYATSMLATSAGWLAYSHAGVTDLPMSAAFAASMLLAMSGGLGRAAAAGVLLGLAVLAKGLAPAALALPLVWFARRWWRELLVLALVAVAIAAPWYALCSVRNGPVFWQEFFVKHHFARFTTDALQHRQPLWFYVPVLAALLYPWTPVLVLAGIRDLRLDLRCKFLLAIVVFGFVFFSLAANKLPGYLLPLMPAACALGGIGLSKTGNARWILAATGALLAFLPVVATVLPQAVAEGLSRSHAPASAWAVVTPGLVLALLGWVADKTGRREAAVVVLALAVAGGVALIKLRVFPAMDRIASARPVWREAAPAVREVCVEPLRRDLRYGLNYYAVSPLPDCSTQPKPLHIRQRAGGGLELVRP